MRKGKIDFVKGISFVILAISFFWDSGSAAERKKPTPLKELQDPQSPFYVPCPYPKTRNEIIEDLKYAIKLRFSPSIHIENGRFVGDYSNAKNKILLELLKTDSAIHVDEVERIANRTSDFPDEYFLLITLKNKEGQLIARLALNANGWDSGGQTAPPGGFLKPLKSKAEALKDFSAVTDISEIKKMERIFTASYLAMYPFLPAWEFIALDNSKYYLDVNNRIYRLKKVMNGKRGEFLYPGSGKYKAKINEMIVYDSLNDKTLFLKKIN
jgi:hypothetical protein